MDKTIDPKISLQQQLLSLDFRVGGGKACQRRGCGEGPGSQPHGGDAPYYISRGQEGERLRSRPGGEVSQRLGGETKAYIRCI